MALPFFPPVADVAKTSANFPTNSRRRDQKGHPANGVLTLDSKRFSKQEVNNEWPWISIFMEVCPVVARVPALHIKKCLLAARR
jgi:hypothetical protein